MTMQLAYRHRNRVMLVVIFVLFMCLLSQTGNAQSSPAVTMQGVVSSSPDTLGDDAVLVTSKALNKGVSLRGLWRFKPGDDLDWASPSLDDSNWDYMEVPGRWPSGGYPDSGQLAWYRMTVHVQSSVSREGQLSRLAIHLGIILSAYELYAGGQRLGGAGSMPPLAEAEYDRERIIYVPASAIEDDGSLVLALRVWGGSPRSVKAWSAGPSRGQFVLGEYRQLLISALVSEAPAMAFCIIFVAFGFYHLYLYYRNSTLNAYLWFGLMAITISIYGFMLTQYKYLFDWPFVAMKKVEFGLAYLFPALVIQMIWSMLSRPIGIPLRAYQFSFVLLAFVLVVTPGQEIHFLTLNYWQLWLLPLLLYIPWLLAREAMSGNKDARILAVGVLIFVGTCINDLLIDFTHLATDRLAPIGFLAILLSMAISLADRFTAMFGRLEVQVAQRTLELREANERLAKAARVDHLTGLLNRRGFTEELELEMGRVIRTGRSFSVVLADVDNFKKFNDTNGHHCGDLVLKQIATLLVQRLRKIDCVARWGGEEFILLLPETGAEGAAIIAEKLREVIEALPLHFEGQRLSITMTLGVAGHRGDESIDACIGRADAALYEGKGLGRNTVVVAGHKGLRLVN